MTYSGTKGLGARVTETYTLAQSIEAGIALGEETEFGGTRYRFVKAAGTVALGDALIFDTGNADEPNAVLASSAVNQPVAGIAHVAITSASYGWIVVKGKVAVAKVAASTAAGGQLGTSAVAGTLSTMAVTTPTAAEVSRILAAASGAGVIAMDAEAGGLTEVFVNQ